MDYPEMVTPGYYDGSNLNTTGYPPSLFFINKIAVDYIVGLGLGINFKKLNFKYVVYTMPYIKELLYNGV